MEPFLGQIMMVGFNFAPRGWALCDGQILPIAQNQSLFSLLGTTYGGDGRTSFALPDLRGRAPTHFASGFNLGTRAGEENHILTAGEVPAHTHTVNASSQSPQEDDPAGNYLATGANAYTPTPDGVMTGGVVTPAGSNQGHNNMQPYQVINFVIALQGLFPSRN